MAIAYRYMQPRGGTGIGGTGPRDGTIWKGEGGGGGGRGRPDLRGSSMQPWQGLAINQGAYTWLKYMTTSITFQTLAHPAMPYFERGGRGGGGGGGEGGWSSLTYEDIVGNPGKGWRETGRHIPGSCT